MSEEGLQIPWLDPSTLDFPDTDTAMTDPNGLLAVGGDLSPVRLEKAYRLGIFPWFDDDQPILWWAPDPRAVLYPSKIKISRSLAKTVRQGKYRVSMDTAFDRVIAACSRPRSYSSDTWISYDMIQAYSSLFRRGIAHSVEAWQDDKLVGGLYGIAIGKLFFGESMFSIANDASKVCFVHLAQQLEQWGYHLIDCQLPNDHLNSLGAETISRESFTDVLHRFIDEKGVRSPWKLEKMP